jgi:predicted amidohydrolase
MGKLRVAAVQMRSGTDVARNVEAMSALVREAAAKGAHYVQTPEMTGGLMRNREALFAAIRAEPDDAVAKAAQELAAELRIHLHVGSTAISLGDRKVANRALLYGPDGRHLARYDKIHMFDVDLDNGESWRESATYQPGSECVVADLGFARMGLAVCYDLRFPNLFQAQAREGADMLTVPAAFTRQTGQAHWHVLLRARAIENGAFVIAAAQGGKHEDGRETFGHSLIVDPWGGVMAEADHDEPGVILADLDLAQVGQARRKIPNLVNGRDFRLAHAPQQAEAQRSVG